MKQIDKCPSFELIGKAVSGDKSAIMKLLKYYDAYISKSCLRPMYGDTGSAHMAVDMELKGRIQTRLINAMLRFELKVK